jgi:hypothetical protein
MATVIAEGTQQGNGGPMSPRTAVQPPPTATASAHLADPAAEVAVLGHLLDAHPRPMTLAQLTGELAGRCGAAAVRRALRNLAAASFVVLGHELAVSETFAQLDRLLP